MPGYLVILAYPGKMGKGIRLPDCHICQHLAVNFDVGSVQVVNQLAVSYAIGPTGGIYAANPETSHIAFSIAAVDICIVQ